MLSLWQDDLPEEMRNKVEILSNSPEKSNFVIIGGGLTGISLAYHFAQRGIESLVIERRRLAGGATGRNGGILHPKPSDEFEMKTAQEMKDLFEHEVQMVFNGCVKYNDDGKTHFDPFVASCSGIKLVHALAALSQPHGQFLENISVTSFTESEKGGDYPITLQLSNGLQMHCKKLIVANNAWIPHLLPFLKPFLSACTNCVCGASNPISSELCWDFSTFAVGKGANEIYGTLTHDNKIVLGGLRCLTANNAIGRDDDYSFIESDEITFNKLIEKFSSLFPKIAENITFDKKWIGAFAVTKDGLPIIGEVSENVYVVGGYNGHGMPRCFNAAKILIKHICKEVMNELEKSVYKSWNVTRYK